MNVHEKKIRSLLKKAIQSSKKDDPLALKYLQQAEQKISNLRIDREENYYYRLAKCFSKLKDAEGVYRNFRNVYNFGNTKRIGLLKEHCKRNILEMYYESKDQTTLILFEKLFDLFPNDAEFCLYYGVAKIEIAHNYQEGKRLIDNAFNCETKDISWLYAGKGAVLYDYLNEKENGLEFLKKAVELNRNQANLLAYAYRLSESDYKTAHEIYSELYKTNESVEVLSGLAETFTRGGDLKKGLQFALKVYQADPDHAKNASWLGYIYFQLGEYKKSLDFYKKCDSLSPYNKKYVYNSIAECYEKLGDKKKANVYNCRSKMLDEDKYDMPKAFDGKME